MPPKGQAKQLHARNEIPENVGVSKGLSTRTSLLGGVRGGTEDAARGRESILDPGEGALSGALEESTGA